MEIAIEMAREIGGDRPVDYVNTHGTSTPVGDVSELNALKAVFDADGRYGEPFIGSTKSLTGHAVGAAGVHEAIYSLLMMRGDYLAPSANIDTLVDEAQGARRRMPRARARPVARSPAPLSPGLKILREPRSGVAVKRVLSNSFGFGGTNACLVLDKYTE